MTENHEEHGDRAGHHTTSGSSHYTYTTQHRLPVAETPEPVVGYAYDAAGRRIMRIASGGCRCRGLQQESRTDEVWCDTKRVHDCWGGNTRHTERAKDRKGREAGLRFGGDRRRKPEVCPAWASSTW